MIAWPLLNRNKVEDSKVIVPVQACASLEHEGIVAKAQKVSIVDDLFLRS